MEIMTPQLLYHGTTDTVVAGFQSKLLNSKYWKPGRDFGEGFYTTISAAQARKWAHRSVDRSVEPAKPCVLTVELTSMPKKYEPRVFLSESPAWSQFIFDHRTIAIKGEDPCDKHPDIVIGPMADNDTGKIVLQAVQLKKDADWFYDQITRTGKGRRLDSLRLGNQVVFSSERWESSLRLVGYSIFAGGRWIYHENASQIESL
ncbi:DUF3990 domain-containing protein [Cohnella faecalis]|uniref:DUF3990 domain-containing protein n=1 Tax=Cohnella faecalis TaxID=2315694 RepID=A0A398CWA8_9BACL|nr:DUF3990 domain-containing protein [Cohnella faecalis]RIE04838.1 DUF3990 domain-containing protein [Cohnella faecalis]